MNPVTLFFELKSQYLKYIKEKFPFAIHNRHDLLNQLEEKLSQPGHLFQDPILQFGGTPKTGIHHGLPFDPLFLKNPWTKSLIEKPYLHQAQAWQRLFDKKPTVISTGTGSGKSESFMLPIIHDLFKLEQERIKNASSLGSSTSSQQPIETQALIIYPMNALVEDQLFRWLKYTAGTGLRVTVYTGEWNQLVRNQNFVDKLKKRWDDLVKEGHELGFDSINKTLTIWDPLKPQETPHILLTNYKMLDYALMRNKEKIIFEKMNLRYLVIDEAHMFSGTLGLDLALLILKLRHKIGSERSQFLPIATSATLARNQSKDASTNLLTIQQIKEFFEKLFGVTLNETESEPTEGSPTWLISDQLEPIPPFNHKLKEKWQNLFAQTTSQLVTQWPALNESQIWKILLPYEESQSLSKNQLAQEFLSIILTNNQQTDWIVTWREAQDRFHTRTGLDPNLFPAILKAMAWIPADHKTPLIQLKIHSFVRPQPKTYMDFSFQNIYMEDEQPPSALLFVSCSKCGHMALGAIASEHHRGLGGYVQWKLKAPQGFTSDEDLMEIKVFHRACDLDVVNAVTTWVPQRYSIDPQTMIASELTAKTPASDQHWIRYQHTKNTPDLWYCPQCQTAKAQKHRPILNIHPSLPILDLGVQAQAIMRSMNQQSQSPQKLLFFTDSRQQSARLAGGITQRNRRENLRRLIFQTLKQLESRQLQNTKWEKLSYPVGDKGTDDPYPFARSLLMVAAKLEPSLTPINFDMDWDVLRRLPIFERDKNQKYSHQSSSEKFLKELLFFEKFHKKWKFMPLESESNEILKVLTLAIVRDLFYEEVQTGSLVRCGLVAWDIPLINKLFTSDFEDENFRLTKEDQQKIARWLVLDMVDHYKIYGFSTIAARENSKATLEQINDVNENNNNLLLAPNSRFRRYIRELFQIKDGQNNSPLLMRRHWKNWIRTSDWEKLCHAKRGQFHLKPHNLKLTTDVCWIRGSKVGYLHSVPKTDEEYWVNQPTGFKNGDFWEKIDSNQTQIMEFSRSFYQKQNPFQDSILALEHNGMLSAENRASAIEHLRDGSINALVATPTLEVGVDLPDVPTVIHHSVPPDPANYTQRSGRAGRSTKLALIHTLCGSSLHDLTFFAEPRDIISGEINPPGMLPENADIFKKHINGLIIQILSSGEIDFDVTNWYHLQQPDAEFMEKIRKFYNPSDLTIECTFPKAWEHSHQKLHEHFHTFINQIQNQLGISEALKKDLQRYFDNWVTHFKSHIQSLYKEWKTELDRWFKEKDDPNANYRKLEAQIQLLKKKIPFLHDPTQPKGNQESYSLNILSERGFLPSFSFPTSLITFEGLSTWDNYQATNNSGTQESSNFSIETTRDELIALREISPESIFYGYGQVFQIRSMILEPVGFGSSPRLCSAGCSDLIEDDSLETCPQCGSPVLSDEKNKTNILFMRPKKVRGESIDFISDRDNENNRSVTTQLSRFYQIPEP
ncbi:MAG: DEAD/DEAH box helicase, partial [Pseudobdellovibrionaceae bacterium]|nr:DEAD/DEAH box helicase [Pseudobdellovibrionaceae bacterium]